jgi:hypothetical protein
MRRPLAVVGWLTLLAASYPGAQQPAPTKPPPGAAIVTGRVIDGGTGEPIANAAVYTETPETAVASRSDGRFVVRGVRAGRLDVFALKPGYLHGFSGPQPGEPAIVKLTAPGKTPRVPLRYAMPLGAKAKVDMTLTTEASMDMTGLRGKLPMLSLLSGVELRVNDVSSDGEMGLDIAFVSLELDRTNPRVDLAAAGQVETWLAGLIPFRGNIVITSRGIVISDGLDLGGMAKTPARDALRDFVWLIEHITPVLPEEPVGVGAKWESRKAFRREGMTSFHRVEYEVTSIDDAVIKLKTSINQMAPKQVLENPLMFAASPPDVIERLSGKGSYTSTIALNAFAPSVRGTTTTTALMQTLGKTMTISTTLFAGIRPAK